MANPPNALDPSSSDCLARLTPPYVRPDQESLTKAVEELKRIEDCIMPGSHVTCSLLAFCMVERGFAASLHAIRHPDDAVSVAVDTDTIRAAVRIARYLIPHAEFVLTMMQIQDESTADDARYVLQWIIRRERRRFTKRDSQQHGKRRFPRADDIDPALAELKRRGYVRRIPNDAVGPGRPASPEFEVNPAAFDAHEPEKRSQNSQNPAAGLDSANSENSESAFQPPDPEAAPGGDGWGEV